MDGVLIRNCHSSGNEVTGVNAYIGGITGFMTNNAKIENSYSTSKVDGNSRVGGLVGYMDLNCTVTNVYSTGKVTGMVKTTGGLIGEKENTSIVRDSYYDIEVSNQADVNKGEGLSTDQFMTKSTFNTAWNINGNADSDQPWVQMDGDNHPYLYSQSVAINNGLAVYDVLNSYAATSNGSVIDARGFRYALVTDSTNWTEVPSPNNNLGLDQQDVSLSITDWNAYYIQPYAKNGTSIYRGSMVEYMLGDRAIAKDVFIEGDLFAEGGVLEAKYTYESISEPEKGSLFKWFRSDDASGQVRWKL